MSGFNVGSPHNALVECLKPLVAPLEKMLNTNREDGYHNRWLCLKMEEMEISKKYGESTCHQEKCPAEEGSFNDIERPSFVTDQGTS